MCTAFFPRYFFVCRNQIPQNRPRVFFSAFFGGRFYVFQKQYVFLHCFDQTAKIEVALDIDFPKMGSALFFRVFVFWVISRVFKTIRMFFFIVLTKLRKSRSLWTLTSPKKTPRFFPRFCFLVCRTRVPQNGLRVFFPRCFLIVNTVF